MRLRRRRSPLWRIAVLLLYLLILGAGALTVGGFLGHRDWRLELLSHFRVQYLVLQCLALGGLYVLRPLSWRLGTTLVLIGLVPNLWLVGPYWLPVWGKTGADRVKLLHMNVYAYNQDYARMAAVIRKYDPDIVDIMEYTEEVTVGLEATGALDAYPHRWTGRAHLGLYSKRPLSRTQLNFVVPEYTANNAQLHTQMMIDNEPVTLIIAHPHWPVQHNLERQKQHFDAWIRDRPTYGKNLVIVGDLNTAPWSRNFRRLIRHTDLRDSQLGFGIQPSWPTYIPPLGLLTPSPWYRPFGIPIDHVLVSPRIRVLKREVGPFMGSDHLPVYVELGLARR
jgi:endonuclease/exonuclease/phosphatase (EEP) superfamily protein YafD